jgi:hypothetical protein
MNAPLDVLAQTGGEIETSGLDDDLHGGTPGGLSNGENCSARQRIQQIEYN